MTKNSLGSFSFKAFCFLFLRLFFQFSLVAQNSNKNDDSTNQALQTENQSESELTNSQNWNWNVSGFEQNQSSSSTFGLFVKMVFALTLVLALAYFAVRILKRGSKLSNSDDPFLRHVSHLTLSTNRSVDVITILDHAYILGVSDNSVNLIGQIDDKELVNSMNLSDKNDKVNRPRSFDDILSIFMPGSQKTTNQNIYGSSAFNAAEALQRQRNRLNEEE